MPIRWTFNRYFTLRSRWCPGRFVIMHAESRTRGEQSSRIPAVIETQSSAGLSPPNPTPSRPVGGEVVYVSAPNPVWVEGSAGIPARTMFGSPKFGWLKTWMTATLIR